MMIPATPKIKPNLFLCISSPPSEAVRGFKCLSDGISSLNPIQSTYKCVNASIILNSGEKSPEKFLEAVPYHPTDLLIFFGGYYI